MKLLTKIKQLLYESNIHKSLSTLDKLYYLKEKSIIEPYSGDISTVEIHSCEYDIEAYIDKIATILTYDLFKDKPTLPFIRYGTDKTTTVKQWFSSKDRYLDDPTESLLDWLDKCISLITLYAVIAKDSDNMIAQYNSIKIKIYIVNIEQTVNDLFYILPIK